MSKKFSVSQDVKTLAEELTKLEIRTWQLHDKKLPITLINAMAALYEKVFDISYEDALTTLEPWVSAVWWHDIAETAEDGGDLFVAHLYWQKVHANLLKHYSLLVKKLNLDVLPATIAQHDFERWGAHHRRQFDSYVHHDASIVMHLFNLPYEDAHHLARLRGEAVWMHNDTHLETGVLQAKALELWQQATQKLQQHYIGLVILNNSSYASQ